MSAWRGCATSSWMRLASVWTPWARKQSQASLFKFHLARSQLDFKLGTRVARSAHGQGMRACGKPGQGSSRMQAMLLYRAACCIALQQCNLSWERISGACMPSCQELTKHAACPAGENLGQALADAFAAHQAAAAAAAASTEPATNSAPTMQQVCLPGVHVLEHSGSVKSPFAWRAAQPVLGSCHIGIVPTRSAAAAAAAAAAADAQLVCTIMRDQMCWFAAGCAPSSSCTWHASARGPCPSPGQSPSAARGKLMNSAPSG